MGRQGRVPVVKQQMGSDPASVAFDTLRSAVSSHTDVVIIDTAGRLHNKINLMSELSKIKRVMEKLSRKLLMKFFWYLMDLPDKMHLSRPNSSHQLQM